ncbi:MAG: Nif3-like dinuclear metal center hexameric protein [Ignavibacteria bacterium]
MTVQDVLRLLTTWAPNDIAGEKDNVGLQVGDGAKRVSRVCVSLDVTQAVVREAAMKRADVIVSHHPLLFRPPKSITPTDEIGACVQALIEHDISVIAAHTNLDFTRGGTSFALADVLNLRNVEFLHRPYRVRKKIVTFVPESHLAQVREAMAAAGAGIIGNYDHCSFGVQGMGSFRGNEQARPTVGKKQRLEFVNEVRLEMIAEQWNVHRIIQAMRAAHPYEEVAYDVYPLDNVHADYGMGIIGEFARPLPQGRFLRMVKMRLGTGALRYCIGASATIRRVAACGGSGAELTDAAIAARADAFITADVKYHDFHHAAGKIVLVDAGHFETEHPVVRSIVRYLETECNKHTARVSVFAARTPSNPVHYL